jgi:hypothetical protein
MKKDKIIYWAATGIIGVMMLFSGFCAPWFSGLLQGRAGDRKDCRRIHLTYSGHSTGNKGVGICRFRYCIYFRSDSALQQRRCSIDGSNATGVFSSAVIVARVF